MIPFGVKSVSRLKGEVSLLGDKSIAHRSVLLSALTKGQTIIENFPLNQDCLATLGVLQNLGVKLKLRKNPQKSSATVTVAGKGLWSFKKPQGRIFTGDSGTTARLILGVLSAQRFPAQLFGGRSLSLRPMFRVTSPLRLMGAKIKARVKKTGSRTEEFLPISLSPASLRPMAYKMPVASAQVKSALLLAALHVKGKTVIKEPISTRDHTERMLKLFKADLKVSRNTIVINGGRELVSPRKIRIPGDISSAAFFMVLGTIIPKAQITLRNVCLNPTRSGIIRALKQMGADLKMINQKADGRGESSSDIAVKSARLKGIVVSRESIPGLIDELPILMVAACFARGRTVLKGINELRVKETDRIRSMVENLKKMGADICVSTEAGQEKITIRGTGSLRGAKVRSFGDHRTAMSLIVAGLAGGGETRIDDVSCISKSFPDFLSVLNKLAEKTYP